MPHDLFNVLVQQHSFNHNGLIELKSKTPVSQLGDIPLPVPQARFFDFVQTHSIKEDDVGTKPKNTVSRNFDLQSEIINYLTSFEHFRYDLKLRD